MAEEYIIGNNAQFNENVDILGKLNLFDDINTKNIKISGTTDITGDLTASNGIFSGFLSATNVSVAQSVTANEYYGTFKGSIDPSVANDKITEGDSSAEIVDSGSNGHFKVLTDNTEKLRITSSGNVGIGTDAPSAKIEAYGTDASIIAHNLGDSRGGIAAFENQRLAFVSTDLNDDLVFGYSSNPPPNTLSSGNFVERMRIDNGTGFLGIGTIPQSGLHSLKHVRIDITPPTDANPAVGTGDWATETALVTKGDYGGGIALNDHDQMGWILHTTGFGDRLHLLHGTVGGASTEILKVTGSGLFGINESNPLATLHVQDVGSTGPVLLLKGGNASEGDITVPGGEAMQFGHWNSDNTFTERFKIHSNGHVYVEGDFTVRDELNMHDTNNENKYFDIGFQGLSFNMRRTNSSDGAHSNFITVNSSKVVSGNFNDTSDEKLKKNIATISDGAIEDIKKLRPVTFDWIDETEPDNESGFIAQEVKQVLPNLVDGTEYDPTLLDEEKGTAGGIKSQGYSINTIGVTAHLTKALQEAIAKIEVLEAKIAALESA